MVGLSVSCGLMIFLYRVESRRYRALRDAAHALADVLRGLGYAIGSQPFRSGLPGRFAVNFSDGVFGGIQSLRCGGLRAPFHRRTGLANETILDVSTGQRAGDESPAQQTYAGHQQGILFNGLEN